MKESRSVYWYGNGQIKWVVERDGFDPLHAGLCETADCSLATSNWQLLPHPILILFSPMV